MPLHRFTSGEPAYDWHWNCQPAEVGHGFICGPCRSGKSVFDPDAYRQALARSAPRRSRRRLIASAQQPETNA